MVRQKKEPGLWLHVSSPSLIFDLCDSNDSNRGGMCLFSGAVITEIYTVCLNKFGYKATLIGWAVTVLVLLICGLFCIQPRTNYYQTLKPTRSDFNFSRKPLFWVLATATIIQGLAQHVPSVYLPSYAHDMSLSSSEGALLVSLLNLASAIGQPLQGMLA